MLRPVLTLALASLDVEDEHVPLHHVAIEHVGTPLAADRIAALGRRRREPSALLFDRRASERGIEQESEGQGREQDREADARHRTSIDEARVGSKPTLKSAMRRRGRDSFDRCK